MFKKKLAESEQPAKDQGSEAVEAPQLKTPHKKWLLIMMAGILIIVLAVAGASFWFFTRDYDHESQLAKFTHSDKVVFKIGTKAYTKKDVDKLALYLAQVKKEPSVQASKEIFALLKTQAAAQKAGITPSDTEISTASTQLGLDSLKDPKYNPYFDLTIYQRAIQFAALRLSTGDYRGYSFVFWFGKRLILDPQHPVSGFGDAKLIATDREYAQAQANSYHGQIKDKKITPDQALDQIKKDIKLSYLDQFDINPSVHFGGVNQDWKQQIFVPAVMDFVSKQSAPGLSTVQTGRPLGPAGSTSDATNPETFFYFTLLDSVKPPISNIYSNLSQNTKTLKSKYYGY